MKYGLWDVKDKCWMGQNKEGPILYDEEQIAKAAAMIVSAMFKFPLWRIRAVPFISKNLKLKDHVNAELTCEEAIISLEGES